MTTTIRGFVVDDHQSYIEVIEKSLDLAFEKFQWKVTWTDATTALAARLKLRESEPFHFAILDVDLGEGDSAGAKRKTSQEVVNELRERGPTTFILVITGYANDFPTFIETSRRVGAHPIIRAELDLDGDGEWTFRGLAEKIRKHVQSLGDDEDLDIKFPEESLGVKQMLHTIGSPPADGESTVSRGERIVRGLMASAFESDFLGRTTLEVSHLGAGRSGAHVLRVDRRHDHDQAPGSYVLKLGLDRRALDQERRTNRVARQALGDALIEIIGDIHTDPHSGFAAIVAPLATRAVTLAAWLTGDGCDAATPPEAQKAAEILFGEHLDPLFGKWARKTKPIAEWLDITPGLELRVMNAVSHFRAAWSHEYGANQTDVDDLADLLTSFATRQEVRTADPARAAGDTPVVHAFGDLHTGNVLIQQGVDKRPVLVDASIYGPGQHWALDTSRLIVDIVLRVRGSGTAAMLWHGFGEFRRYAASLCTVASAGVVDHDGTEAFVRHVLRELPRFAHVADLGMDAATWHWQWHAALAKEFLRQGTHPEMAPPQAVLTMTAAADHLTRAAQLVDGIDYTGAGTSGPSPCAAYALTEAD